MNRPAGKLSGGMKQKLSLCCALIHDPDLLILDEPTTGVDPLSRRQFWELIENMRAAAPGMSVIVATAYMDEAAQFKWTFGMYGGKVMPPGKLRTSCKRQEKKPLRRPSLTCCRKRSVQNTTSRRAAADLGQLRKPVIEAEGLTRRFGSFTAVDHVSFRISRGEIFGFLGSNGCGKSTTMKMLTGLLPATSGTAKLFGAHGRKRHGGAPNVGYMSQAFSLYSELTVRQNLELHAQLYHLPSK